MDTADVRATILKAYGINEDDPDWIAYNRVMEPLEAQAKAEREWFANVVIPHRIAGALEQLNAKLREELGPGYEIRMGP